MDVESLPAQYWPLLKKILAVFSLVFDWNDVLYIWFDVFSGDLVLKHKSPITFLIR
jgi:hypothetical protein